jgi:hypothetical protein
MMRTMDKATKGKFASTMQVRVNSQNAYDITGDIFKKLDEGQLSRFKMIDGHEAWGVGHYYYGATEGSLPKVWMASPAFSETITLNFEWDNCCGAPKWKFSCSPSTQPGFTRSRYAATQWDAVDLHKNPISW